MPSRLLPLVGCCLFVLLYITAALFYPGGTWLNKNSQGFSWTQNYWCNLLSDTAINGQPNPARPIAFTAMIVLCLTLSLFWYGFPKWAGLQARERTLIQYAGLFSMITCLFIFTSFHDTIINVAGAFGLVAMAGTLSGLRKLGWSRLFYMGILVLVLIGLNNLLYYEKSLNMYLPVVQKFTFLYFLLWICLISMCRQHKTN